MKYLIVPIEVKSREFDSRVLLALEAVRRGYRVIVGNQAKIARTIDYLPRGIYFDKSISKNKLDFFRHLKDIGYILTSVDEEGLMTYNNKWVYLKQRISKETLSLVSKFFAWGEHEYNTILDNYPDESSKVESVGNPRVDLCCGMYKHLYEDTVRELQRKYGEFILFPSSFSVNHAAGNGFIAKQFKQYKIVESIQEKDNMQSLFKYEERAFVKFVELVEKVAHKYKKLNIIVRPHPAEDPAYWQEATKYIGNVFIEGGGSVAPWILASTMVIHSSCTTGLESFVMEKPVIAYLPYTDHEFTNHISNKVSKICNTVDYVMDNIEYYLHNGEFLDYSIQDRKAFVSKLIANTKVSPAYIKIVDAFEDLGSIHDPVSRGKLSIPIRLKALNYFRDIKIKFNRKRWKYIKQKYPGSKLSEICLIADNLGKSHVGFENIDYRISEIADEIYMITKA